MTYEWVLFAAASFTFVAMLTWMVLPYVRKRSEEDKRLSALEAANVELRDRVSRFEQAFEGPTLPRGLPRVGTSR